MNEHPAVWRTLVRQGLASLALGFGAGLASAIVLCLLVLWLSYR